MRVTTGRAAVRAARVVNRGGVDPVDAVRMALRVGLFDGHDMPDWRREARSREIPADLFFTEPGEISNYREARLVCAGCPVRAECVDDVLAWERPGQRHGVVGGMSPVQREQVVRARHGGAA